MHVKTSIDRAGQTFADLRCGYYHGYLSSQQLAVDWLWIRPVCLIGGNIQLKIDSCKITYRYP